MPLDEIKGSGELIAGLFFERECLGRVLERTILPLAIAISAAGNVMVVSFAHVCSPILGPRGLFTLSLLAYLTFEMAGFAKT